MTSKKSPGMKRAFLLVGLAAALSLSPIATQAITARIHLQNDEIKWVKGSAALPAGTQLVMLEGSSKKSGLFTMRIKFPAGSVIPPHVHPQDERVTVLSGSILIGYRKTLDKNPSHATRYKTGAYFVTPANTPHFGWTDEEVVLQLTNFGPWEIHYLTAAH